MSRLWVLLVPVLLVVTGCAASATPPNAPESDDIIQTSISDDVGFIYQVGECVELHVKDVLTGKDLWASPALVVCPQFIEWHARGAHFRVDGDNLLRLAKPLKEGAE